MIQNVTWHPNEIPAIYLYEQFSPRAYETLAHELGHFLGLAHTFVPTCSVSSQVADSAHHEESYPDEQGLKYTCEKTPFMSEYVMDYYASRTSFNFDQVGYMRAIIKGGRYIPSVTGYSGGRQPAVVAGGPDGGVVIPCVGHLIP